MSNLKLVWQEFNLGGVTIPNRIVRSAHGTGFSGQGLKEDIIAYHVDRARAGVGLSVIEMSAVHPSSAPPTMFTTWDDSVIDQYRRLKEAVSPYGMVLFQQIAHAGNMYPGLDGLTYGPSATASPYTGVPSIPMSKDQIAELVAAFAASARRSEEGGVQGLEIQGAHGYVVTQFLSPLINRREDEYGGSLENRMRFLREVLRAVKGAVSPSMPVGLRLSDEGLAGGLAPEDAAEVVRILEENGEIDFIHGSAGSHYTFNRMIAPMEYPIGTMLSSSGPIAAGARRVPRIVTAGRLRTLEDAEQLLRDDVGDLIVLNRAMIADPFLVSKTREGRMDEVRPCIACNQGCVGGSVMYGRMTCAVNPAVGMEQTLSETLIEPTGDPKKVLIIGGGPAGMEAARLAALSGHKVTLVEAAPDLGGNVNVAKLAPRLHTLADITYWLEKEVYRLGVEVRNNYYMEADDVVAENPDVVIVATGSLPSLDGRQAAIPGFEIKGLDSPHILSPMDVLTGGIREPLPKSAVVYDDVGSNEALSVAEWLVEHGVAVTFVTRFASMTPIVDGWMRVRAALQWLNKGEFELMTYSKIVEVRPGTTVVQSIEDGPLKEIPADVVVLGLPRESLRGLYDDLKGRVPKLKIVGDAKTPRDVQAAIFDGHMAGRWATEVPTDIWHAL